MLCKSFLTEQSLVAEWIQHLPQVYRVNFGRGCVFAPSWQGFPRKFRVEQYSCSFWSKIKGFNISIYIPLTISKGNERKQKGTALLYSALRKPCLGLICSSSWNCLPPMFLQKIEENFSIALCRPVCQLAQQASLIPSYFKGVWNLTLASASYQYVPFVQKLLDMTHICKCMSVLAVAQPRKVV